MVSGMLIQSNNIDDVVYCLGFRDKGHKYFCSFVVDLRFEATAFVHQLVSTQQLLKEDCRQICEFIDKLADRMVEFELVKNERCWTKWLEVYDRLKGYTFNGYPCVRVQCRYRRD